MEYPDPQSERVVLADPGGAEGPGGHAGAAGSVAAVAGETDARGRTTISETAVEKVAGIAARAVPGVHSLGTGSARALGAIRGAVGSSDHSAGVHAEVGETQVAVDINLVANYGTPLHSLADAVRAAVYRAVEELVGLQVIEVNVEINDVYIAAPAKPGTDREVLA